MKETITRAGERAGAAVDSGVRTARKTRDTAQSAVAERAGQAQEALAEHWDSARDALAEGWSAAQDIFTERLNEARHELATRIEPELPPHRRRWTWWVLLFGLLAGVAGAVLLTRRPHEIEPEPFVPALAREPGSRDSDPVIQAGNGVVGSDVSSSSTERPS